MVRGARVEALIPCLPTAASKAAAELVIGRFGRDKLERIRALPHQVVHNDLNTGNLMATPGDARLITGVIDFGDVLWTATIADAAIAATSLLTPGCDVVEALVDFLCGYRLYRKPTAEELTIFPSLVAMRLLLLMVVPVWHRTSNPTNPHYQNFNPEFEVRSDWINQLVEMNGTDLASGFK